MPIKYLSWTFAAALSTLLLCVCGVRTQSRTNERTAPSFECVFSVSSFHAFLAVESHLFNYVSLGVAGSSSESRKEERARHRHTADSRDREREADDLLLLVFLEHFTYYMVYIYMVYTISIY
jgi:hypothetical protein